MAGKLFFLSFALPLMSILASAHRPFVADKHEVTMEPSGMMKSHHNELKIDALREKMGGMENPVDGEMNKMHDMGKWEMAGKGLEHDDAPKLIDREMNKMYDMGKWEMNKMHDMGKWEMQGKRLEHDGDDDDDGMKKWEMMGKKVEPVDATRGDELRLGLYDVPNPDPYPDVDTGFHFDVGPIGFGFDGGLQWGGNPSPVFVVPYGQPYVVVSPQSVPYTVSPPYPYPPLYQQPGSVYQQPGSGYGMPQSGQDGPYPSPGGYGQGQGPYQKGWRSDATNN